MKKIFLIAALLGTVSPSFGQGIVDFGNFSNSQISTNSVHNGPATGLMSGPAGTYYFALLEGFTNATSIDATLDNGTTLANGGWIFSGNLAQNTTTPGILNGNYTPDPGVLVDIGYPPSQGNFVVVGWSANIGTTYSAAKTWWNNGNPNAGPSGWFAISDIAQGVVVGGGVFPVPTIFGPTVGGEVQGFTLNLYTVPEPSSFAFAFLGTTAFLIIRKKLFSDTKN